ncbi:uncharacterized protein LOC9638007 [Selaginella moellendorffii]|uniref:uncharacterized protein LOC9638007 n=1 Tax=Selaginella moellendorffii TaxID=88036 RepID=UPI000D1C348B|nr:uncharacterized protein LOC9638007 [Selaginella moellendorffii]|eukprot:XP_024523500.1 uncharacterized protein LOC9638007 [Selaginella moellendorffii]
MIAALPSYSSSALGDDHDEQQSSFQGGILEVRVHDAQGIHNICIYDKQDVFAKFSFTHGKAEPVCTQVIAKAGKNPVFNESFQLPVTCPNSVLKCEMWMSSRAHSYLEDQLLGFALVPLSSLASKGQDQPEAYGLSSTELFHSPAGIVRLTLAFREGALASDDHASPADQCSPGPVVVVKKKKHGFIKVFEDGHASSSSGSESPPWQGDGGEFERIEFPDLQAASEDQQLVSSYLEISSSSHNSSGIVTGPSLLFEAKSSSKDHDSGNLTSSHHHQYHRAAEKNSSPSSSEVGTTCSDDHDQSSDSSGVSSGPPSDHHGLGESCKAQPPCRGSSQEASSSSISSDSPDMQQQFVDMYMKSMQQFTEALAKMQLPLDLDRKDTSTPNAKKSKSHQDSGDHGKNHRVFYGSRAFF